MQYSYNLPGNCGCNNTGIYGTNMWNVNGNQPGNQPTCGHPQACNGCIDIIKGICLLYGGVNLTNTGINKNDTFDLIIQKLDAIKAIQDTKNINLLAAINDLNTRINTAHTQTHPPYTIL